MVLCATVGAAAALGACDAVIGLSGYSFDGSAVGLDASDDNPSAPDTGNCNVDLTKECYPCAPQTNEQYANKCSQGAVCTGFQDLTGLLLPDGGLPPLPPLDGGNG